MALNTLRSAFLTLIAALALIVAVAGLWATMDPGFRNRLLHWADEKALGALAAQLPSIQSKWAQMELAEESLADQEQELLELRARLASLEQAAEKTRRSSEQASDALARKSLQLTEEKARLAAELNELRGRLDRDSRSREVAIEHLRNDLTVIRVGDQILFDTGSAALKDSGRRILGLIAQSLNKFPDRQIRLEGHSDDRPIVTPAIREKYPTNWELSAARAVTAARYLEEQGKVAGERLMPTGLSRHHPVAENRDAEGRRKNRRLEIVLMPPADSYRVEQLNPEPSR